MLPLLIEAGKSQGWKGDSSKDVSSLSLLLKLNKMAPQAMINESLPCDKPVEALTDQTNNPVAHSELRKITPALNTPNVTDKEKFEASSSTKPLHNEN